MKTYRLIKIQIEDLEILNNIIKRSARIWNYSEDHLKLVLDRITMDEKFLADSIGYCASQGNEILGFFAINLTQTEGINGAKLYIEPHITRSGIGTILWNKVIEELKMLNIKYIHVEVEPKSQTFYEKMGAVVEYFLPSILIKDRMIPIMKYTIIEN